MINIAINGKKDTINKELISQAVNETLGELTKVGEFKKEVVVDFSVALVAEKEIEKINKQYRQQDKPTDVLSFCYEYTEKKLEGEIVLCPEIIKKNAQEDGVSFEEEFMKNVVHGTLHIVGYEHGKEMFDWQNKILKKIIK
jgi:probable rRNA maturation factor